MFRKWAAVLFALLVRTTARLVHRNDSDARNRKSDVDHDWIDWYTEHLHGHSDKMIQFWKHARNRVSRNAYTFVSRMRLTEDSDAEVIL